MVVQLNFLLISQLFFITRLYAHDCCNQTNQDGGWLRYTCLSISLVNGSSQSETRDYMRLKTLIEGIVYIMSQIQPPLPSEFIARDCKNYQ